MLLLVVFKFSPGFRRDKTGPRRSPSVLSSGHSLAENPCQSKPGARRENGCGQRDENRILSSVRFGLTGVQSAQPIDRSSVECRVGPDRRNGLRGVGSRVWLDLDGSHSQLWQDAEKPDESNPGQLRCGRMAILISRFSAEHHNSVSTLCCFVAGVFINSRIGDHCHLIHS